MSFARTLPAPMTADQFIDWPGDGTDHRHQLIEGEPVAMSPPTWRHNVIATRLAGLLNARLRAGGTPCEAVFAPGVQLRTRGRSYNVRVPDLGVSCSRVDGTYMHDPVVLVEVLSPSNVLETREAARTYQTIPSVQEVLVIDSRVVGAEMLRRQTDGSWPSEPIECVGEGILEIPTFGFSCSLAELYPE